jgi:hypothetical protein
MKYVKKPIVIEAVQWTGENLEELVTFLGGEITRSDIFGNIYVSGNNFVYQSIDPKSVCTNFIPQNYCQLPLSSILNGLFIKTLEGNMQASVGDYIIKGIKGEYYPCKPDIFEQSYEKWEEITLNNVCNTIFQPSGTAASSFITPTIRESEQVVRAQEGTPLTFGQNLAGVTFNPSGNQTVNEIKTKFAELIDLINTHYEGRTDYQFEALIIYQNCLQHLLDAQMNCVKLVTYKQN